VQFCGGECLDDGAADVVLALDRPLGHAVPGVAADRGESGGVDRPVAARAQVAAEVAVGQVAGCGEPSDVVIGGLAPAGPVITCRFW
jgi:hypothetical protein